MLKLEITSKVAKGETTDAGEAFGNVSEKETNQASLFGDWIEVNSNNNE
ncbi:unnamed protein product, partial [Brassica oleracea]